MISHLPQREINKIVELGKTIREDFTESLIGPNDKVIVYRDLERILGFAVYNLNYETLDLLYIAVLEQHRKKGIATALIEYLSSIDGISHIMVEVKETNLSAISFYQKNDFKKVRKIKNYYKDADGFSMEKIML